MALGYCRECEELVTIEAKGLKDPWMGRQRKWFPVKHKALNGEPCDGDKKEV